MFALPVLALRGARGRRGRLVVARTHRPALRGNGHDPGVSRARRRGQSVHGPRVRGHDGAQLVRPRRRRARAARLPACGRCSSTCRSRFRGCVGDDVRRRASTPLPTHGAARSSSRSLASSWASSFCRSVTRPCSSSTSASPARSSSRQGRSARSSRCASRSERSLGSRRPTRVLLVIRVRLQPLADGPRMSVRPRGDGRVGPVCGRRRARRGLRACLHAEAWPGPVGSAPPAQPRRPGGRRRRRSPSTSSDPTAPTRASC